jgi:hypothetical protein
MDFLEVQGILFLLEIAHWSPPSSRLMVLSPSVKALGCEADKSASGVEVKNVCSYGWLHTAFRATALLSISKGKSCICGCPKRLVCLRWVAITFFLFYGHAGTIY